MNADNKQNRSGHAVEALKLLRILIRAAQRHSSLVEKQCGVSGAQLWVLQEVNASPGLRVGDVAERLAIHQTTASNLIDSLAKKGCIDKLRDPTDSRIVKLVLSREGKAVLGNAPGTAKGLLPDALAKLNEEQLQDLIKGLQAVLHVIGEHDNAGALLPLPFMM